MARWWLTQQFGHSTEILDSSCQQELVLCSAHPAQPQPIQLLDGLEMRKQYLGGFDFSPAVGCRWLDVDNDPIIGINEVVGPVGIECRPPGAAV